MAYQAADKSIKNKDRKNQAEKRKSKITGQNNRRLEKNKGYAKTGKR